MLFATFLFRSSRIVSSASSGLSSTSKISTSCDMDLLSNDGKLRLLARGALRRSNGEEERRPTTNIRLSPNPAPVFPNNTLHNRKAHSGAFKIAGFLQSLK